MHKELMDDLEKVFNTLSRIQVSDIGVDLMYSAKEQLKAIYAKLQTMDMNEKEVM